MASETELRQYHQKRNFTRTKEPRGQLKRKTGDLFVVQKHAARRLHYDFRLELDGVLKSWAVTKGPSLSPADKRLAVRVEDHPLDYAEFEGRIPEGEYGAGSVIVWDRGRWSTEGDPREQLAKGHLIVDLHGRKLKGRWHLVHMRGRDQRSKENWLLIKADDEYATIEKGGAALLDAKPRSIKTGRTIADVAAGDVKIKRKPAPRAGGAKQTAPRRSRAGAAIKGAKKASLPSFIEPQLASLAVKPPVGESWVHEIKFDGYRLIARIDRGHVKLKTRNGLDWTTKFPSLKKALEALPVVTALLDGEVVVETEKGTPSFADLQADLSEGRSDRFRYYVFDLLHLDGADLTRVPLVERKRVLADVLGGHHGILAYSEHFAGRGDVVFDHACRLGLEGIVSKLKMAPYRSGRSKSWLKTKCVDRHELVIIGYVPSATQRKVVGSLVVGHHAKGELVYAGRVGSGFSEQGGRRSLAPSGGNPHRCAALDKALPADSRRNVRWVKPKLVADVEIRGWTTDGIARHAVFKGLRHDKVASDVVRAAPAVKTNAASVLPVNLTHPDRVLWPDTGITKQGLADFYAEIWPWISSHVVNRPLALVRCPGGVEEACFFQKHAWAGIDEHIIRARDPDGGEELLALDNVDGLRLVGAGIGA